MTTTRGPAAALLHRLACLGGWAAAPQVMADLPWASAILEDHLADLVTQGRALYNSRSREYRLAGEPAQRRAVLEVLRDQEAELFVKLVQGQRAVRVGIARRVAGRDGLVVTAEIELPRPAQPAEQLAQDLAIAAWAAKACGATA